MKDSAIEWTDHTFNPWHGCLKVSPGCEHCYAETLSRRWGHNIWGPPKTTERRAMSDAYWQQPRRWNEAAKRSGTRARVFCASMADVFEDHPQVAEWRTRLWALIEDTPWLDWLLLTKRPESIMRMVPWIDALPENIWIGTSCEDQKRADERIPHLLRVPARVRFLSCEPLLGPINLNRAAWGEGQLRPRLDVQARQIDPRGEAASWDSGFTPLRALDWVIVGGESGHGARPMHPDWARSIRNQCADAGVAFFFKQWGEHAPIGPDAPMPLADAPQKMRGVRRNGSVLKPADTIDQADVWMWRAGKHVAGRVLDGRTHDAYPEIERTEHTQ